MKFILIIVFAVIGFVMFLPSGPINGLIGLFIGAAIGGAFSLTGRNKKQ